MQTQSLLINLIKVAKRYGKNSAIAWHSNSKRPYKSHSLVLVKFVRKVQRIEMGSLNAHIKATTAITYDICQETTNNSKMLFVVLFNTIRLIRMILTEKISMQLCDNLFRPYSIYYGL